jgi:hypothetical protein
MAQIYAADFPEIDDARAAAAFRQLVAHLRQRSDVQNIDLMNLAGFCRNCLADWYAQSGSTDDPVLEKTEARSVIYGMHPDQWKAQFQR